MKVEAIGYKLLNGTRSLNGLVDYSQALAGKWQRVPGRGAFVAHCDGLFSAWTDGDNVVRVECAEQVSSSTPPRGVKCWRYVRMRPATAKADGKALAALVRASAEDALQYGAKALASIVPPSTWADAVRRFPDVALLSAAGYLAKVVPPSVWADVILGNPYDALHYGAEYLAKVVPAEAWADAVQKAPYTALRYAAGCLAGVVPAKVWERARASCGV